MSGLTQSNLVDFDALALEQDEKRRSELARHVAMLFSRTSERCTDEQIAIYDDVMVRLSAMIEQEARAYLAQSLSTLRRAPERTVLKLAKDDIQVAEPLLKSSTVLRDLDLQDIASNQSNEHRLAIAQRTILPESVTNVLVAEGDLPVKRSVAANAGAQLSDASVEKLIETAADDEVLQLAIGEREDLVEGQIKQLIEIASEKVKIHLLESGRMEEAGRLSQAAGVAASKLGNEFWLGRYDFETAEGKVYGIAREGQLGEHHLRQFAEEDRFPEAVAAFSVMARLGAEEARHWMVREDTDPFIVAAKSIGLSFMTVRALLKIGPWRYRLSQVRREHALELFQRLSLKEATRLFSIWEKQQVS
ncbi:DUF2336 domain-containing protein [Pseudovibrio exalbescens]|uniref:DUF2336 domain-containing protein n=1 Tax=Pseudovibrio exalbescens TaxID=197461 RepID=A0A1U7JL54_9HYPH|nr:DUF2336 domain-containing protein [Pseudovibrio exalbescens]OKL45422.1 hypothetical protein A3843_03630 [Pseudovibrio exalbescens]